MLAATILLGYFFVAKMVEVFILVIDDTIPRKDALVFGFLWPVILPTVIITLVFATLAIVVTGQYPWQDDSKRKVN